MNRDLFLFSINMVDLPEGFFDEGKVKLLNFVHIVFVCFFRNYYKPNTRYLIY